MARLISENAKKRGRPVTTGRGTLIGVRLRSPDLGRLDAWIERQRDPRPSRPEAMRQLASEALDGEPHLTVRPAELSREIKALAVKAAAIAKTTEASRDAAPRTMDKALAEAELVGLKTRRKRLRKPSGREDM